VLWVLLQVVESAVLGSGDALPYHNRLNAGKYLVVVQGSESVTRQATRILRSFEPENLKVTLTQLRFKTT